MRSGHTPLDSRFGFSRRFLRTLAPLLITSNLVSLTAFAAPEEGDVVTLSGALNGRSSAHFSGESRNIKYTLGRGTTAKIEKIKRFKSGNYALLVKITSGSHLDDSAWIHYRPGQKSVDLCRNEPKEGESSGAVTSCAKTEKIAEARGAEVKKEIPAERLEPRHAADSRPVSIDPQPDLSMNLFPLARAAEKLDDTQNIERTLQWLNAGTPGLAHDPDPCNRSLVKKKGSPDALLRQRRRALSCLQPSSNSMKPDFGSAALARNQKSFVEFIAPIAVAVQQETGYPASVLIAQAEIESNWGTSWGYQTRNNLFGQSCTSREFGSWRTYAITLQGKAHIFRAHCNVPRPAREGGYYLTFDSPQDSIYAYVSDVVLGNSRYYKKIQRTLNMGRIQARELASEGAAIARYSDIVSGLGPFARDKSYRNKILREIQRNRLYAYDQMSLCTDQTPDQTAE